MMNLLCSCPGLGCLWKTQSFAYRVGIGGGVVDWGLGFQMELVDMVAGWGWWMGMVLVCHLR